MADYSNQQYLVTSQQKQQSLLYECPVSQYSSTLVILVNNNPLELLFLVFYGFCFFLFWLTLHIKHITI